MCLRNISGDFSASNIKKTGLNESVYDYCVGYRAVDTSNIIEIHKYWIKTLFGLIKSIFIGLLTSIECPSNHAKYLSQQQCMTEPTLINLHPNKYSLRIT